MTYFRQPEPKKETDLSIIFQDIVDRVSERLGTYVNFQFGDWPYISGVLQTLASSKSQAKKRYPVICLFLPSDQSRDVAVSDLSLDFLIAVDTLASYTNEERRDKSFRACLIPIYELFIEEILKDKRLDKGYRPSVPHIYTENYRYGRIGVTGPEGKSFSDKIDAIDIKDLKVKLKK